MNNAFYSNPIKDFVSQKPEIVLGHLAARNPFALDPLQRNAWLGQIESLRTQLRSFEGWIAFEFAIPRMGKRADVVLIIAGKVFRSRIQGRLANDRTIIQRWSTATGLILVLVAASSEPTRLANPQAKSFAFH
jgi:hypothetical protein